MSGIAVIRLEDSVIVLRLIAEPRELGILVSKLTDRSKVSKWSRLVKISGTALLS